MPKSINSLQTLATDCMPSIITPIVWKFFMLSIDLTTWLLLSCIYKPCIFAWWGFSEVYIVYYSCKQSKMCLFCGLCICLHCVRIINWNKSALNAIIAAFSSNFFVDTAKDWNTYYSGWPSAFSTTFSNVNKMSFCVVFHMKLQGLIQHSTSISNKSIKIAQFEWVTFWRTLC